MTLSVWASPSEGGGDLRPCADRYGEDCVRRDLATVWSLQGVFMLVPGRRELDFVDARSRWGKRLNDFLHGEWHTRVLQRVGLAAG